MVVFDEVVVDVVCLMIDEVIVCGGWFGRGWLIVEVVSCCIVKGRVLVLLWGKLVGVWLIKIYGCCGGYFVVLRVCCGWIGC